MLFLWLQLIISISLIVSKEKCKIAIFSYGTSSLGANASTVFSVWIDGCKGSQMCCIKNWLNFNAYIHFKVPYATKKIYYNQYYYGPLNSFRQDKQKLCNRYVDKPCPFKGGEVITVNPWFWAGVQRNVPIHYMTWEILDENLNIIACARSENMKVCGIFGNDSNRP